VIAADAEGRWNQQQWVTGYNTAGQSCGTAGCFAGWRCFLDGFTEVDQMGISVSDKTGFVLQPTDYSRADFLDPRTIPGHAAEVLGLDRDQAMILFEASNTLEDLKGIVDAICANDEKALAHYAEEQSNATY